MSQKPGRASGFTPEDILARMSLDEKIGQLHMVSADAVITGPSGPPNGLTDLGHGRIGSVLNVWGEQAIALQRLNLEQSRSGVPLLFCLDVVHGHRTVFPVPLGEAASFSESIWRETAAAAAREAAEDAIALTFAPMVDVSRDPRWGRICESAGEDPLVNARMARAKVLGFQGQTLRDPARIAATVKHFAAYGAGVGGREYDSADVSDYAMAADYLPPFRAAVEAGVAALMPAFLDVAGVPMTGNRALLVDELRTAWGFSGVTITDYNAVAELIAHGAAETGFEAAVLAFNAGNDVDMVSGLYHAHLADAVAQGRVTLADVDAAALRMLRLKHALGLFEDPYRCCPAPTPEQMTHRRDTARRAARASLTLLSDPLGVLPLPSGLKRIALIGALATSAVDMHGAWAGSGDAGATITIADGLRQAWPQAQVSLCADDAAAAAHAAEHADVAILCLGETAALSGEAAARSDPVLPAGQQAILDAVLATGTPTVVLLSCGRPLVAPELFSDASPCAVLVIWGPGSEAGHAIADVLGGVASPAGRLPVSWPRSVGQIPVFHARRPTGRPHEDGNRYSTGYADLPITPQFPFGHGLSYARFVWSDLKVTDDDPGNRATPLTISLSVRNASPTAGDGEGRRGGMSGSVTETVFLFASVRIPGRTRPLLLLRDFAQIELGAGESGQVSFSASVDWLAQEGQVPTPDAVSLLEIIVAASADPEADPARHLRHTLVGKVGV